MNILLTIPDAEAITRDSFKQYMRKLQAERRPPTQFGFSKKHTKEIVSIRENNGVCDYPAKLYNLPVSWNTEQTYFAN